MREQEVRKDSVGAKRLSGVADTLQAVNVKANYDMEVKKLFAEKEFLAVLLKEVVEECHGLSEREIIACIEGEVQVAGVPVMPRVQGTANESAELGEGVITYDLRFHMYVPGVSGRVVPKVDSERKQSEKPVEIKLLINLEAQRKYYVGYDLLPRSVFYACRMISAQKGVEFTNENYDDIKRYTAFGFV